MAVSVSSADLFLHSAVGSRLQADAAVPLGLPELPGMGGM